jgi:hypothetical protein
MKNLTLLALILIAPLACRAADDFTPLNVKPGLWESTVTTNSNAALSEEVLAKIPPEQRARMEAAMKDAPPQTFKSCVTSDSLKKSMGFGDSGSSFCKRTLVNSSSNSAEYHIECSHGAMQSSGDGHLQALSSESLKGESAMKTTMPGGRTTTMNVTFTSRWLGADCGSVKPK